MGVWKIIKYVNKIKVRAILNLSFLSQKFRIVDLYESCSLILQRKNIEITIYPNIKMRDIIDSMEDRSLSGG